MKIAKTNTHDGFEQRVARELLGMAKGLASGKTASNEARKLLKEISSSLVKYLPREVEDWAVEALKDADGIDIEYSSEPGQNGGWDEPSFGPSVDAMWFDPKNFEFFKDWSDIISAAAIEDEVEEFEDMGSQFRLEKVAKSVLRSFKIVLNKPEVNTDNFYEVIAEEAEVTIDEINRDGITFNIQLSALERRSADNVEDRIMNSRDDW